MKPIEVNIESKIIAGVRGTTSNEQEGDFEVAKIPLLWREYFQNSILYPLANEVQDSPAYAVYHNFQNGVNGEYDITIGTEVSTEKNLETGYKSIVLKEGKYLRFDAKGEMPMVVVNLWQEIWTYFQKNGNDIRTFETDFEIYTGDDELSIYIGIK